MKNIGTVLTNYLKQYLENDCFEEKVFGTKSLVLH